MEVLLQFEFVILIVSDLIVHYFNVKCNNNSSISIIDNSTY